MRSLIKHSLAVFATAALTLALSVAHAADSAPGTGWKYTADIYLFAAGVGGETKTGGDVDIGFDTLLKDLDMGFMGVLGARKGMWSLNADVIYLDVSADNSGQLTLPGSINIATSSTAELKGWIVTPYVRYNLIDTEQGSLDAIAGARYLYLDASLKLTTVGPIARRDARISGSGTAWNGIVGVRGRLNVAPKWYVPYYADVGTGESNLTWQLFAGVGYQFKSFDAVVGYRYLAWNDIGIAVFKDLDLSGPLVGVKFDF